MTPTPSDEAVSLPTVASTAPERIFLVIGEDCPPDARWDQLAEVLWCEDNIDGNGIVYERADLAEAQITTLRAQLQQQALQHLSDSGQWIEEVGRLRAELQAQREDYESRLKKLCDHGMGLCDQIDALKACRPDVEEAARALITARDNFGWSSEVDDAINVLRAKLEANTPPHTPATGVFDKLEGRS
jgi:hypothetical protein